MNKTAKCANCEKPTTKISQKLSKAICSDTCEEAYFRQYAQRRL